MRRFRVFLFLLALPVCAGDAPRADLQRITAGALKAHVSFLASDLLEGRGTPSRGLDVAGEYIAAQFTRLGLEPAAGGTGFFQIAEFVQVTPNLQGLEVAVDVGGRRIAVPADRVSIGGAQPNGINVAGVEAVRVAPGSPVRPELLAGKVALVEMPDFGAYPTAEGRRKAAGTYRQLRRSLDAAKPAAVLAISANAPIRRAPPTRLVPAGGPVNALWVQVADAGVMKAVQSAQTVKVTLRVPEPRREPVRLRNVAGLVRGSDPMLKDTYVIVSAHYDHVGVLPSGDGDRIMNGANDNASGTASLIEAAAALVNAKPRRSILFIAWFGEEIGLLGSRHYARHPLAPLEQTVANINLEQTGRTDAAEGPAAGRAVVTGFNYSDAGQILIEAGSCCGVTVIQDSKLADPYFARSDNVTFAELGIPAHTVGVALEYPDYHLPSDHSDKLDYGNMEKVTKFIAAGVAAVANREQPPNWNAENPAAEPYLKAARQKTEPGIQKGEGRSNP